jgi:predicted RNA-binding Zn-ribbon protein involved in translation (DUF1610 family)
MIGTSSALFNGASRLKVVALAHVSDEATMATVFMTCSSCHRDINTHIEMDPATFMQLPLIESEMVCPKCGARNFWDKSKARLADRDGESSVA